jgi:hypothetical protein
MAPWMAAAVALLVRASAGPLVSAAAEAPAGTVPAFAPPRPLRVCFTNLVRFSAQCTGSPPQYVDHAQDAARVGCPNGAAFCGYDVSVWANVAAALNLTEGVHYQRVCLGDTGFSDMVDSLAHARPEAHDLCDIAAQGITATTERENLGILFSRATYRGDLATMIYASVRTRGYWAFLRSLHRDIWATLGATVIIVPILVFCFESVLSTRCEVHGLVC